MKASYSKSPCNLAQPLTLIIRAACQECVCEGGGTVTQLEASPPKDIMSDTEDLSRGAELYCWDDGGWSDSQLSLISSWYVTWRDQVKMKCT